MKIQQTDEAEKSKLRGRVAISGKNGCGPLKELACSGISLEQKVLPQLQRKTNVQRLEAALDTGWVW